MPETLSIVDAPLLARWTIDRGLAPVAHGIEEMDTTRIVEVPV